MVLPLSFLVLYVNHQLYHYMYMHVLNKENSAEFMKHISLIQRDFTQTKSFVEYKRFVYRVLGKRFRLFAEHFNMRVPQQPYFNIKNMFSKNTEHKNHTL